MSNKTTVEEIKQELKSLIIENLSLEDLEPEDIDDNEMLFGDGLGLDSLDAVEIVVILQRNWNIEIKDIEKNKEIFTSINTLAQYIYDNI